MQHCVVSLCPLFVEMPATQPDARIWIEEVSGNRRSRSCRRDDDEECHHDERRPPRAAKPRACPPYSTGGDHPEPDAETGLVLIDPLSEKLEARCQALLTPGVSAPARRWLCHPGSSTNGIVVSSHRAWAKHALLPPGPPDARSSRTRRPRSPRRGL